VRISINPKDNEIAILETLGKVGLGLKCVGRFWSRDDRQRIYKFIDLADGRAQVFEAWLKRDEALAAGRAQMSPWTRVTSVPTQFRVHPW